MDSRLRRRGHGRGAHERTVDLAGWRTGGRRDRHAAGCDRIGAWPSRRGGGPPAEKPGAHRTGDHQRFQLKDAEWTRNAEEIAALLASANPNWAKDDLVDLLGQHLSLTKQV